MVITLIFLILLAVFLAFFVGKNLSNVCTFWFFKTFNQLPVSILVFIAFAAGIVVALLFFLAFKLRAPSEKERVKEGVQNELNKMEKRNRKERAKKKKTVVQNTSSDVTVVAGSVNSLEKEKSK